MNLVPSPQCKHLIVSFEGYAERLPDGGCRAYPDPGSPMGQGKYPKNGPDVSRGKPWTIGFGATGPGITRGTVWTLDQAERAFDEHIAFFAAGVNRLLRGAKTTQNQFDALVSFAYNVGLDEDSDKLAEGLGDSTLLRKHLAGDYAGAAAEFAKWNKAGKKVLAGLTRRRAAEAALYSER